MATKTVVELTPDEEKLLRAFQRITDEDQKMRRSLNQTGEAIENSAAKIRQAMVAAGEQANPSVEKILKSLKSYGTEGKRFFDGIEDHLRQTGKLNRKSVDDFIEQIRRIDPELGDVADKLKGEFERADAQTELKNLFKQLRRISPEGAEAANAFERAMEGAAGGSAQAIERILNKVEELDPTMAMTVTKVKADLAEAAKFGEGKFADMFAEMRKGDPISRQVAEKIKQHLVATGQIVERSFNDMVKPLEAIDPNLAKQAKAWKAHLEHHERDANSIFSRISGNAIAQIMAIGGSYIGFQEAVQKVSEELKQQQEIFEKQAEAQKEIAQFQQDAAKNLAGFSVEQQRELLTSFVQQTAKDATFNDLGQLTKAVGDAASAGASFEQIKEILPIAAGLNRFTPDFVDETATAIADAMKATGSDDAKANIAQQLLVGGRSRIVDPGLLLRNLAPVQISAAGSLPEGADLQTRTEAARQASAIFAAFTQAGGDDKGESSRTATNQFLGQLRTFFGGLQAEVDKAKTQLAELKDPVTDAQKLRLSTLTAQQAGADVTAEKIAATTERLAKLDSMKSGADKAGRAEIVAEEKKLRTELTELRKKEFTEAKRAELTDLTTTIERSRAIYNRKRAELQQVVDGSTLQGPVPVLPFDQLKALQSDPELMKQFGPVDFGEQQFRTGMQQMVAGTTAFQHAFETINLLRTKGADPATVDRLLSQTDFLTPQMEEAFRQAQVETASNVQMTGDSVGAARGSVRASVINALKETRSDDLISSMIQGFGEVPLNFSGGAALAGGSNAEEIVSGIEVLTRRRQRLTSGATRSGGITPIEQQRIERLQSEIENLFGRLETELRRSDPQQIESLRERIQGVNDTSLFRPSSLLPRVDVDFSRVEALLEAILKEQRAQRPKPTDSAREAAMGRDRRSGR